MNIRAVLTLNAFLATIHGPAFILAPSSFLALYQIQVNPGSILMGQLFGAELVFIAILCWMSRECTNPQVLKAFAVAGLVANAVGGILCAVAIQSGVAGEMGWLAVVIYGLLAVAFGLALPRIKREGIVR